MSPSRTAALKRDAFLLRFLLRLQTKATWVDVIWISHRFIFLRSSPLLLCAVSCPCRVRISRCLQTAGCPRGAAVHETAEVAFPIWSGHMSVVALRPHLSVCYLSTGPESFIGQRKLCRPNCSISAPPSRCSKRSNTACTNSVRDAQICSIHACRFTSTLSQHPCLQLHVKVRLQQHKHTPRALPIHELVSILL